MATTIQIKRGTGSAVPSGLADGELAINLDDGQLYFGSGSNSVTDFKFGDITATNLNVTTITSSIVTSSIVLSEGSNIFGDAITDTQKFNGHITASGNISASGDVTGQDLLSSRDIISSRYISALGYISSSASLIGNEVDVRGHITASGNISAAGNISASSFTTPLGTISGFSGSFSDISASGTIIAATLDAAAVSDTLAAAIVAEIDNDEIPIAKLAEDAVTVTAGTGLTGGGSITLGGSATVNVIGGTGVTANANDIAIGQDVATTANVQFANITSSANISASGNIIAVSMSAAAFSGDGSGITNVSATANAGTYSSSLQILSNVTASGNISSSGTITAATLDAAAVSDTLAAAIVAEIDNDEIPIAKLAEDAVTVTAGTGLTGAGAVTLGGAVTMNVIGGDGITANANDIAITAAQTTITSIYATDLVIGEDAQTKIDFETANEIHLDADNAEVVNVRAGGIEITGDVTASAGIHAAAVISGSGFLTPLGTVSGLTGSFGNISSSGTITANSFTAPDGNSLITLGGNRYRTVSDNFDCMDGGLEANGDITASGDISSSGVIISSELEVDHRVFDTGSVALSGDGGSIGDIVKFGSSTTVAGGIYALTGSDWSLATATSTAFGATSSLAIALGTNPTTHGMCIRGFIHPFADPGAPLGNPVYLHTTIGRFTDTAPSSTNNVVRILGHQYGTDLIYFNPSNDFIVHE